MQQDRLFLLRMVPARVCVITFVAVIAIGAVPGVTGRSALLLGERFFSGGGFLELLLLGLYAGWLVNVLLSRCDTAVARRNVWLGFSAVFFTQAILGCCGFERFLMTGTLHLPVPAMIIAAPVYRGTFALFMPILLFCTILLVGPAWCSWLCYMGSLDFAASRSAKQQPHPVRHPFALRLAIVVVVVGTAYLLRKANASAGVAAIAGICFGVCGIAVMVLLSRKRGVMVHCTAFCPIGLVTTVAGKINPFRIRIGKECAHCHSCIPACRYGALDEQTIGRRQPGYTCTLCGDCLSACPGRQIAYHFPGLSSESSRTVFVVAVVVLHTLFLGFARV